MDSTPTYSPEPIDQRCVVLVTTGPFAGLHQINGTVSQLKGVMGELPEYIPHVTMPGDEHVAPVGLIKSTPRYVLFKECNGPVTKTFNERQL